MVIKKERGQFGNNYVIQIVHCGQSSRKVRIRIQRHIVPLLAQRSD